MPNRLAFALVFIAAIGSAGVGGILYGFSAAVMPGLARLPAAQAAAAMNAINGAVFNPAFMAAFMGTALLCCALAACSVMPWINLPQSRIVLAASAVYLLGTFGVTMVFNVPLNDQLAVQADPLWASYLKSWTTWNHLRSGAAFLSAVLFTLALVRSSPS